MQPPSAAFPILLLTKMRHNQLRATPEPESAASGCLDLQRRFLRQDTLASTTFMDLF